MAIRTRQQLIDYGLRNLGHPVIQINIDDDQIEDRVDDAIQYFTEYTTDGQEQTYLKYVMTQSDIDNGYVTLTAAGATGQMPNGDQSQAATESGVTTPVNIEDSLISILEIFHFSASSINMFDIRYQYVLNDLYTMGSIDLQHYYITQEYLSLLRQMLSPDKRIRFNRRANKLYIDTKLSREIRAGSYLIISAYRTIDPTVFPEAYDDILLKRYVTALFKRQWGANLSKFQNIQLPGGVIMNGEQIYGQAIQEIQEIENTVMNRYQEPPSFFVGE
jgi:hypothetical protein